jgi:hypothetical protein
MLLLLLVVSVSALDGEWHFFKFFFSLLFLSFVL